MVVNGYVKDYKYAGDGTLLVQVRIPAIHGPMNPREFNGQQVRSYTRDGDLPFYQSVLLPHLPTEGEVVMLMSTNERTTEFVVIGLTGGSYYSSKSNTGD